MGSVILHAERRLVVARNSPPSLSPTATSRNSSPRARSRASGAAGPRRRQDRPLARKARSRSIRRPDAVSTTRPRWAAVLGWLRQGRLSILPSRRSGTVSCTAGPNLVEAECPIRPVPVIADAESVSFRSRRCTSRTDLAGIVAAMKAFPSVAAGRLLRHGLPSRPPLSSTAPTALPLRLFYDEGVRRYGFHGLSYEYIARKAARTIAPQIAAGRVVVAASRQRRLACARSRDGRSVATHDGLHGPRRPADGHALRDSSIRASCSIS